MTDSFSCSRLTNSRRRVSRAQIGAYSGQVREEHRFTSSGIGRPQLQRWKRRPRGVADAIAARAPASRAALTVPRSPVAVLPRSLVGHPTPPASPESVQAQSENESPRVKSGARRRRQEAPGRAAKSRRQTALVAQYSAYFEPSTAHPAQPSGLSQREEAPSGASNRVWSGFWSDSGLQHP
jgi:hypothetical protein